MTEIVGTEFNEELFGSDDNDLIIGLSGYDTLDGAEGSDTYLVHAGDFQGRFVDFYFDTGTSGIDTILAAETGVIIGIGDGFSYASSGIEVINGINESTISGDNDRQVWDFTDVEIQGVDGFFGLGGHDDITGSSGKDLIDGGTGHDILSGGLGQDTLLGGEGHDQLFGDRGRDTLEGGFGNDSLNGGDGRDFLNGNAGFDILDGGEGSDVYYVGLDNAGFVDTYNDTGSSEDRDVIRAVEDGTVIGLIDGFSFANGIEIINAARNDNVTIGGTNDAEFWDFTDIKLFGIEAINALGGNDFVTGSHRRDIIDGGDGNDTLVGGLGSDTLIGDNGNDILLGGWGRDRLDGGAGSDILDGGEGGDLYLYSITANGSFDDILDSGSSGRDKIIAQEDGVEIGLSASFDLTNGIEVITSGGNASVTIQGSDAGNTWNFLGLAIRNIIAINSGDGMDIVYGNSQSNIINGEAGHDQLFGGFGADIVCSANKVMTY